MGQAALAIDQDIQPMLAVPRHNHIRFPVPTRLSHVRRQRMQGHAGPVFDPLVGLPLRPLRLPHGMVAGQTANHILRQPVNVLVHGFLTRIRQFALLFQATRDQFRGPADL